MEFCELMETIKTYEEKESITLEELVNTEKTFVETLCSELLNVEVQHSRPGKESKVGKIISFVTEDRFDNFGVRVQFADEEKVFVLKPLAMTSHFNRILNESVLEKCVKICEVHNNLISKYTKYKVEQINLETEAAKKAKAEQKAEERYARLKETAIKDFDAMSKRAKESISDSDFYFALGWLAKNVRTMTAALPDYLDPAFVRSFGADTPRRVVDSAKRGPAGYQSQWTLSFTASLKNIDTIPTILTQYLNPAGKAISKTSFIWDLVEDYGFQFGKKQDIQKITNTIPAKFIDSFNEGLA